MMSKSLYHAALRFFTLIAVITTTATMTAKATKTTAIMPPMLLAPSSVPSAPKLVSTTGEPQTPAQHVAQPTSDAVSWLSQPTAAASHSNPRPGERLQKQFACKRDGTGYTSHSAQPAQHT